jgi:hypothetical protein
MTTPYMEEQAQQAEPFDNIFPESVHETTDQQAVLASHPPQSDAVTRRKQLLQEASLITAAAIGQLKQRRAATIDHFDKASARLRAQYQADMAEIDAELKDLDYVETTAVTPLAEPTTPAPQKRTRAKRTVKAKAVKAKPVAVATATGTKQCKICKMDGHNLLNHVGQRLRHEPYKKFSASELKRLGLV